MPKKKARTPEKCLADALWSRGITSHFNRELDAHAIIQNLINALEENGYLKVEFLNLPHEFKEHDLLRHDDIKNHPYWQNFLNQRDRVGYKSTDGRFQVVFDNRNDAYAGVATVIEEGDELSCSCVSSDKYWKEIDCGPNCEWVAYESIDGKYSVTTHGCGTTSIVQRIHSK